MPAADEEVPVLMSNKLAVTVAQTELTSKMLQNDEDNEEGLRYMQVRSTKLKTCLKLIIPRNAISRRSPTAS